MSIAISEEHQELARVPRAFLRPHDARAESRAMLDEASERMPSFWKEMAELGWMGLHIERVSIGADAQLGMAGKTRLFELMRKYAADDVGLARVLGAVLAQRESTRLLNLRGVVRAILGAEPGAEANVTKLLGSEVVHRIASLAVRIAGDLVVGRRRGPNRKRPAGNSRDVDRRRDLGDRSEPDRRAAARAAAGSTRPMTTRASHR